MNKEEFLKELKERLEGLPSDEIENAINYYIEYFEDAKIDNEADVTISLGTAKEVAKQIMSDYSSRDSEEIIKVNLNKDNENKCENEYFPKEENNKNGVYVIGNHIVNNLKIKGLTFDMLDEIIHYFDIVIIEGDGSKEKSLKGWRDSEPVIYPKTTKTIGVVDISSIGLDINEENIHRVDRFLDIINDYSTNKVNIEHLEKLILNKNGLFKIYKGEKILFINKVENINNKTNALNLIKNIKCKSSSYINRYIYGSIFTNEYIKG